MKNFYSVLIVSFAFGLNAQVANSRLTDVFPSSTISQQGTISAAFNQSYAPSGSYWAVSWDESHVYQGVFTYTDPNSPNTSYELRIGKGGQVYSFKTSSGETIPPQWRHPNGKYGADGAPWIDEVWQLVAVDLSQNNTSNDEFYYIHQAGVYLTDTTISNQQPFFSPLVAQGYDATNQEYSVVNWGQHAHLKRNLTTQFQSGILYYTKFKNLGDGIIQVDYLIYNFGVDKISHINVPWGGVRRSTYDNFFVSNTDNSYYHKQGSFGEDTPNASNTNGWVAFSSDSTGSTPSLGLIMNNAEGRIAIGDAGGTIANRNYTVYSGIKTGLQINFGDAVRARNYFILGSSVADIQSKVASLNLQANTFFDYVTTTKSSTDVTRYYFKESGTAIVEEETTDNSGLSLNLQPYDDSYPLFIIKGLDNFNDTNYRITSNVYTYSDYPYDGKLLNTQLIGFSDAKVEVTLAEDIINYNDNYTFPDGTTQNNITSSVIQFSSLGVDANGYEQLVQTTVNIDPTSLPSFMMWYENASSTEKISYASNNAAATFTENVSNPSTGGINSNTTVARLQKNANASNPSLTFSLSEKVTDLSTFELQLKAYLSASTINTYPGTTTNERVRVILRCSALGSFNQATKVFKFSSTSIWEEFNLDYSNITISKDVLDEGGYDQLFIYCDNPSTTNEDTYYFDQIETTQADKTFLSPEVSVLEPNNLWYYNYSTNTFEVNMSSTSLGTLALSSSTPTENGNNTQFVSKFTKLAGTHSSIFFDLPGAITDMSTAIFKIRMYVPSNATTTNNNIRFSLRKNGATTDQTIITKTITEFDKWVEYTFDFSALTFPIGIDYYNSMAFLFASPDSDSDATDNVYYFDAFQGPAGVTLAAVSQNDSIAEQLFSYYSNLEMDKNEVAVKEIKPYPNPVNDILRTNIKVKQAAVYSINGQLLKHFELETNSFDVSDLKPGVYFFQIGNVYENRKVFKIAKQ